jgi:hypothetical protein
MARLVEIISTSFGYHKFCVGMDDDEINSFYLKAWITHYGARAVDMLQSLSLGFCSFLGGDLWLHNSHDVPRTNLFGEQRYSEVGIVANQDANVIKILDSIGIHSDGEWSVESLTIPKTLNQPNGMYSKLPKERFKKREGIWQAEFLRNMKTTSGTASVIEAIKGESLRGNSAYLVLRNTNTDQVKLYKVDIRMTSSR